VGSHARRVLSSLAISLVMVYPVIGQSVPTGRPWGPPAHFPPDENPQFFPTSVFGAYHDLDARAYSWYLRSMGEQPLIGAACVDCPGTYRVLVLPAFSSPVVVRLTVARDGTAELTAKVGKDDLNPQALAVNGSKTIARDDVESFFRLLNNADFWHTPSVQADPRYHTFGGTSWLLEGSLEGVYHVTSWIGPRRVPCSDAASFLIWDLGRVDLRRLPTQPPARRRPT
jgi:hypothetical protein